MSAVSTPAISPITRVEQAIRSLAASDFARKVAQTYATQILRIGLGLITSIAVARALGPAGRGIFGVAGAIGVLGVQFANLGLPVANTYFVAKDRATLPHAVGNSLVVSFGFGSIFAALVCMFLYLRPSLVSIGGEMLLLAGLWIPFGLAYLLLQNILLGVQHVTAYNATELANRALPVLILAILLLLRCTTVPAVFLAMLLPMILCCVWIYAHIAKLLPSGPRLSQGAAKSNLGYGTKAYLTTLFCFIVLRGDLLLVQHFLGSEQSGYYSIASTMAENVSLLGAVVGTILFPKLSALSDIGQKFRMTRKAVLATAGLLLPMVAVAATLARPIVLLMFGPAFLPAAHSFALLMPGIFFLGINAVAVQMLNSMGYPVAIVGIWGATVVSNIGLNLWVIPRFGIAGASVMSSLSYCFASVAILFLSLSYKARAISRPVPEAIPNV